VTDQQLAFRAIADFGARWCRARSATRRRRRPRRVDARIALAMTASLAPPQRDVYTIPYGPGFERPRGRP
jgi:hypothetical protein